MIYYFKTYLPLNVAVYGLLSLFSLLIVFHGLILFEFIPYQFIWGGKLKSNEEMVVFESVSMVVNLLILFVVGVQSQLLKIAIPPLFLNLFIWLLVLLFVLNTIGNLLALSSIETKVFTPISFVSVVLCVRLAIGK